MEKNKKNYYKKNNHKKNYYQKNSKKEEKKVTYDSLMHANTITETKDELSYDKTKVMKCIAVSVVLMAIIIGSLILFSKM